MTDTAGVGQSRIPQSSPNARTMEETEAMGGETFGVSFLFLLASLPSTSFID